MNGIDSLLYRIFCLFQFEVSRAGQGRKCLAKQNVSLRWDFLQGPPCKGATHTHTPNDVYKSRFIHKLCTIELLYWTKFYGLTGLSTSRWPRSILSLSPNGFGFSIFSYLCSSFTYFFHLTGAQLLDILAHHKTLKTLSWYCTFRHLEINDPKPRWLIVKFGCTVFDHLGLGSYPLASWVW